MHNNHLLMPVLAMLVGLISAEHKVHNIVLYPERHSWCQTTPIKQVVAMPGYEPLTIDNHVCVGACYSYSIPRTQPAEPGELIGPYCDSCQPKTTQCYHVTLKRSNTTIITSDEQIMRKRVQIITDCSCSSCNRVGVMQDDCLEEEGNTAELPASLVAAKDSQEKGEIMQEMPELMALPPPNTNTYSAQYTADLSVPSKTYHLTDDIRRLLKNINKDDNTGDSAETLVDMRHLVEIIQGNHEQPTDRDVIDFVNWANEHEYSEDGDDSVDAIKLKTALDAFHRRELRLKHRKFGLGPSTTPIVVEEELTEGSHLLLGHKKGSHIAMGIHHHHKQLDDNIIPSSAEDEDNIGAEVQNNNNNNEDVQVEVKHAHHVGDAISAGGSVAHLVMGPHGSLVLAAPAAEERLSLASDEVELNQEGAVIDYHHHHHHHQHHGHHIQRTTPANL